MSAQICLKSARSINVFSDHAGGAWLCPFTGRQIRLLLAAMLAASASRYIGDVELTLTDDSHISDINAEFLGCPGPTNIITFPGDADLPGALFLSLDCLRRECLLYRQDMETHFIRLLAHGIGHLAGLDHGIEMSSMEAACFSAGINANRDRQL